MSRPDTLAHTILHALDDAHGKFFGDGRGQEHVAAAQRAVNELLRLVEQRTQDRDEAWKGMKQVIRKDAVVVTRQNKRIRKLEAALRLSERIVELGASRCCDKWPECSHVVDAAKAHEDALPKKRSRSR